MQALLRVPAIDTAHAGPGRVSPALSNRGWRFSLVSLLHAATVLHLPIFETFTDGKSK
jgi:hypothetical protein